MRLYLNKYLTAAAFSLACATLQAQTPAFGAEAVIQKVIMVDTAAAQIVPLLQPEKRELSQVAKIAVVSAASVGALTATFALADEPIQQFTQSHRTIVEDKMAQGFEPLGHLKYYLPVTGAAFVGGLLAKDPNLEKVGLVTFGSLMVNAVITDALKNSLHRHRPNATTENHVFDGPIKEEGNTSMPSSHTSTAFAVATSVVSVYGGEHKFVAPLAYGVATLVGLSRVNDNAHWTTDVMAGAAIGFVTAKGVNCLYDIASQRLKTRRHRLLIAPQLGLHSGGAYAVLAF